MIETKKIPHAEVGARLLELRSSLVATINEIIAAEGLSQSELKAILNISQPRVSNLANGHVSKFSVGTLITMLHALGCKVTVSIDPGEGEGEAEKNEPPNHP